MDEHPAPPHDSLAALTAALTALKPNRPTVTLKTPTFDLSASDQYKEFQFFRVSLNLWFDLQGIPAKPGVSGYRIEYVLNFLATTGFRKLNQGKPAGVIPENHVTVKKSAEGYLDYLGSNMKHNVSQ